MAVQYRKCIERRLWQSEAANQELDKESERVTPSASVRDRQTDTETERESELKRNAGETEREREETM